MISSIISIVLALGFLLLVQFLPKLVNNYIIYVGAVLLLILIICVWTYPTEHTKSKVVIGLLFMGILLILALTVWIFK